jgi:O-antigen/teichoic acid export membrane protein
MPLAHRVVKGTSVIACGEVITQGCNLLRNIILARALTKADFGVAAMLGMIVSLMEIGGRLSIENLVVQSRQGDQPRFVAVAHSVRSMLGLVSGLLILFSAEPMAVLFKVPEAAWALRMVALIPLISSLSSLDIYRMRREMRFGPSVLNEIVPQIIITLAAWPLTLVWHDYSVLVWLLLIRQLISTAASHLFADRPYRWAYQRSAVKSIFDFGWPMMINGLLLFCIMQGDRFVVGIRFSTEDLGVYAIAGTLALLPSATLMNIAGSLLLPVLSETKDNFALYLRRVEQSSGIISLFSSLYAVVLILAGGSLVALIFGPKYRDASTLTALFGFAQALRLLRGIPTVAAMAKGDTKNLMWSNLYRLAGFILAVPAAFMGASLQTIAVCAALGEAVALIGSFWQFSRRQVVPLRMFVPSWLFSTVFIGMSGALTWFGVTAITSWTSYVATGMIIIFAIVAYLVFFKEARDFLLPKLITLLLNRTVLTGERFRLR